MSFLASAENVRVDDGRILRAQLRNANGDLVDAEINLDEVLGNNYGHFQWGGQNFSGSAQNVFLSFEGDNGNAPILRAELHDGQDDWNPRDVNLSERIGNNDGQFYYTQ